MSFFSKSFARQLNNYNQIRETTKNEFIRIHDSSYSVAARSFYGMIGKREARLSQ
jgi:hypothetical protein